MLKLLGLTGGIGSGKSTVAGMLRARGVPVLDADGFARTVVEPGQPAYTEIVAEWPEVLADDGRINRKKLGALVFSDGQVRVRLEQMTHPRIRAVVADEAARLAAQGHRLAFLEAALLVETGLYKQLDGLLLVLADQASQVERVTKRDGSSHEQALLRIRAQLPNADKLRVATFVIDNSGSLAATEEQVAQLLRQLVIPDG